MSAKVIISYDGSENDDDALALGKMLAGGVPEVALAFVRHSPEFDPSREELARHDAERRLEHGAAQFGGPESIPRHVVFSASTGAGLEELAEAEAASLIVFGSTTERRRATLSRPPPLSGCWRSARLESPLPRQASAPTPPRQYDRSS